MQPATLQKINQDGTAVIQTTVNLSQDDVAKNVEQLTRQIADLNTSLADLQSQLDFYTGVQTQQTTILTAQPTQLI